jgi:hypothetical protein
MILSYIDAASGSMLLQIILGGAAAVAVAFKMQWRRLMRFLHIQKDEPEAEATSEPVAATTHESEALDPVSEPVGKP